MPGPKLALLTNPLSGYNRRYGGPVVALAKQEGITLVEAREPGEIATALQGLASEHPDILIVSGGDGTIAAVVSILRKQPIFEKEPILALLRGGSTNMIQNDAGLSGKPLSAFKRLLRIVREEIPESCIRNRSPLKIQRDDGFEEYGFFWSAGALPRVFKRAQTGYAQGGVRGSFGEFGALLKSLKTLLKGDPTNDDLLYPESIGWQANESSQKMFVFVTTLDRLILGLNPGNSGDCLKLVALNYPYTRKNLFTYLRLLGNAKTQTGKSFKFETSQSLDFHEVGDWALDGEFFATAEDPALLITIAAPFRFLIC